MSIMSGIMEGEDVAPVVSGGGDPGNVLEADEALAAGDFVHIIDDAGTGKLVKADAASDLCAQGFVLQAYSAAAMATFYSLGQLNDQLSGMTPGATQWLSVTVPGGTQATAPTGSGEIVQCLGDAISATAMRFTGDVYTVLA